MHHKCHNCGEQHHQFRSRGHPSRNRQCMLTSSHFEFFGDLIHLAVVSMVVNFLSAPHRPAASVESVGQVVAFDMLLECLDLVVLGCLVTRVVPPAHAGSDLVVDEESEFAIPLSVRMSDAARQARTLQHRRKTRGQQSAASCTFDCMSGAGLV